MLEDSRDGLKNLSWIRQRSTVGDQSACLQVKGFSTQPVARALSFYAPDFALSNTAPWMVGTELSFSKLDEMARDSAKKNQHTPKILNRTLPSQEAFLAVHQDILQRIKAQEFKKVVPVVGEQLELADALTIASFVKTFAQQNQFVDDQYFYGFEFLGEGQIGVTPELLFEVKDSRLETMALAGTGLVDGPSLLDDAKEKREHQIVIDHIFSELKDLGQVEIGQTVERKLLKIKHLYTPISLKLNKQPNYLELVKRLHPTAALGGWPKIPAQKWLSQQPFHSARKRFGAPFGFVKENQMLAVVAIRNLQFKNNQALVMAGCGIIEGSDPNKEWKELELKRQSIYQHLKLLDEGILGVTS